MYEDDREWSEQQGLADFVPTEAGMDEDADVGVGAVDAALRKRKVRLGAAEGKRMPVDREEVVRLILQGLRDIGYE